MKKKRYTNTNIYLISILMPVILGLLTWLGMGVTMAISLYTHSDPGKEIPLTGLVFFALVGGIFWGILVFLITLIIPILTFGVLQIIEIYRMWNVINDGKARMTPGEAYLFLLVPFYNFYWIFMVWGGFPTDYNAYLDRYGLNRKVPYMDGSVHSLLPVFALLSVLVITIPVTFVLFYIVLKRNNIALENLVNAINESKGEILTITSPDQTFQPQMNIAI